ncbi:MAG TPA: transport-associated protein, partial [Blastocatellia bacterium]|nr:transport-associated protein [Blastocatellia bacterium]
MKNRVITLAMALVLMFGALLAVPSVEARPAQSPRVQERIRKQLATLPYYGVFDNLAFKMEGDTVTLYGQVRRPS